MSIHKAKHLIARGLNRDVEIWVDRLGVLDETEFFIGDLFWVHIKDFDAIEAHLVESGHEVDHVWPAFDVAAIMHRVLGDEGDFLDAFASEDEGFSHDLFERARFHSPSDVRDRAERAEIVAEGVGRYIKS